MGRRERDVIPRTAAIEYQKSDTAMAKLAMKNHALPISQLVDHSDVDFCMNNVLGHAKLKVEQEQNVQGGSMGASIRFLHISYHILFVKRPLSGTKKEILPCFFFLGLCVCGS